MDARPVPRRALLSLPPGGITRRALLGLALGLPLSALFLWLAVHALDFGRVLEALRRADPVRVGLAVGAMMAVYAVQAERWRWIARHEARLPFRRFFGFVIAGVAANNVVPGRLGEFFRAYLLADAGGTSRSRALATVVVDRVADVLALAAVLAVSYPFLPHPAWLERLGVVAVPLSLSLAAVLAAAWWYSRRSALRTGGGLSASPRSRLARAVADLLGAIGRTVSWRDAAAVLSLSLLAWWVWGLSAWLVASALGLHLSLLEVAFVTAVLNLGTAIPSSPGFIGTYQWLSVAGLGLLGVGRPEAFAFSVLMQAVWFAPTTGIGLALIARSGIGWLARARFEAQLAPGSVPAMVANRAR